MRFHVTHLTDYKYSEPVAEAYLELRLTPLDRETQKVEQHQIKLDPPSKPSDYRDYFGNQVAVFSLPYRHSHLRIVSEAIIKTVPADLPVDSLVLTVQEARQILRSALPVVFDYLQPTDMVKIGRDATTWAKRYLSGKTDLNTGLSALNRAIHEQFKYRQGSTDFSTDLNLIWKDRTGVCQDFAHILLSVLRTAGLPSRYICGYIESERPPDGENSQPLIGSVATHAWVEVLVPGQKWVALDPTNNCWCGEQHMAVSFGRDARDAAPIRGTFKSAGTQKMRVQVKVARKKKRTENKEG